MLNSGEKAFTARFAFNFKKIIISRVIIQGHREIKTVKDGGKGSVKIEYEIAENNWVKASEVFETIQEAKQYILENMVEFKETE